MGFSFNGIPGAEVTIEGSVKAQNEDYKNLKFKNGYDATVPSGYSTRYTVPAGKKWYLKRLFSTVANGSGGVPSWWRVKSNGSYFAHFSAAVGKDNDNLFIPMVAGDTIETYGAGYHWNYIIQYYEEDA